MKSRNATGAVDAGNGSQPPRRAGRPRAAVLDRVQITRAALRIVGERGYEALTMTALAKALEVAPSALYNHAASKQEILQWVQDDLMATVDSTGFGTLALPAALRRWATSYRNVFAEHAPLIPVIAVLPVSESPRTLDMYELVSKAFADAGWPAPEIAAAIVALESFIFGSAMDATAPADIFAPGRHAARHPFFESAVAAQGGGGAAAAEAAFAMGLDAMLAGLMARRAQGEPSPA